MEPDTDSKTAEIPLRCAVCGLPWATVRGGVLMVESRHGGKVHVNTISLAALALVGLSANVDR